MRERQKIVLLCSDGASSRAIANGLVNEFGAVTVVVEQSVSRWQMAKRRMRNLGALTVAGQIMFVGVVAPFLQRAARRRIVEIEKDFGLANQWPPNVEINYVDSVNSESARALLAELQPSVVVVSGTRIISQTTLDCVSCAFINMHAGITPLYRGVHGGYWALVENRSDLIGTTVHFVDKGIDTGKIIEQTFFNVTAEDNFATYPYLHTSYGLPILLKAVRNQIDGGAKVTFERSDLSSMLRYHPTIFQYLYHRVLGGVR